MAKKTIIFRADGNSNIGLGHVIRSLALAEMLKEEFNCEFATRFVTDFLVTEIKKSCSAIYHLPENEDEHFNYFLKLIKGDEIIVLDNYFFSTDYQKKILLKGCKLVCIDDLVDKYFVSNAVINHSPGIQKSDYSCESYTKLAIGLDYALLRNEFLNTKKSEKEIVNFDKVFLSLGGSCFNSLSKYYIDLLLETKVKEVIIIANNLSLEGFVKDTKYATNKIQLYKNVNAKSMVKILDYVDVAVVPSSTLSFEAVSRNTPLITGYFVDNQQKIYNGLIEYDKIKGLGDLNKLEKEKFIESFMEYEQEIKKSGRPSNLINKSVVGNIKKLFYSII